MFMNPVRVRNIVIIIIKNNIVTQIRFAITGKCNSRLFSSSVFNYTLRWLRVGTENIVYQKQNNGNYLP